MPMVNMSPLNLGAWFGWGLQLFPHQADNTDMIYMYMYIIYSQGEELRKSIVSLLPGQVDW